MSTSQTTNVDNIVNRVPEGFYQYNAASKALGWPEDSGSWAHLLSVTHTNPNNYYALQFSGGFFDNDRFFIRKTAGDGNREWRELYHSGNLPALAFDDAAKLRQLGWTGDANQQKLSSRYSSLAAAQAVFPSAQSLDEYIDGCAIERVIQLNQVFYNRSSINIPPGGSKISRAIVTTGIEVSIRGAGRGATQLILVNENSTLIQHGPGDVQYVEGVSQNRQFQIENIFLSAETGNATNTNTRALDISYNATTGWFFQTHIKNVDFRGFSNPIRVINPCRGLQMDTVGIYSLDKMSFQAPAIEIVTTERSRDHSAQGMFKSVRTSGYRWGWDVRMVLSSGETSEDRDNTRRSMEGFIFLDCGSYNGWGMVKVVNEEPRYSSLLWEFIGCDWQGAGNAVDMTRCNQIIVRGGFWIANHDAPSFDQADPTGSSYRRYFKFRGCDNVLLDRLRLDVDGKMPPHCLIEVDVDCVDVLIKDCVVRDYAGNAVAGFSIAGNGHNTVQEIGTVWQVWASREDLKVVDVFANQVSQTRARIYGGVDQTGEYSFRGKLPVTFNANGDVTITLPRRPPVPSANGGNETPFFLTEPVVLVTPLSELIPLRVSATNQWEFVVSGGAAAASKQVWVAWTASGR